MAKPKPRTQPFTKYEWYLFRASLDYIAKGIETAYRQWEHGEASDGSGRGVSAQVIGLRHYAMELAALEALLHRAAGHAAGERVCHDQELDKLYMRFKGKFQRLRALRNSTFAHPPFVDEVLGDSGDVLIWSDEAVVTTRPGDSSGEAIVGSPLVEYPEVTEILQRFRTVIEERREAAADEATAASDENTDL